RIGRGEPGRQVGDGPRGLAAPRDLRRREGLGGERALLGGLRPAEIDQRVEVPDHPVGPDAVARRPVRDLDGRRLAVVRERGGQVALRAAETPEQQVGFHGAHRVTQQQPPPLEALVVGGAGPRVVLLLAQDGAELRVALAGPPEAELGLGARPVQGRERALRARLGLVELARGPLRERQGQQAPRHAGGVGATRLLALAHRFLRVGDRLRVVRPQALHERAVVQVADVVVAAERVLQHGLGAGEDLVRLVEAALVADVEPEPAPRVRRARVVLAEQALLQLEQPPEARLRLRVVGGPVLQLAQPVEARARPDVLHADEPTAGPHHGLGATDRRGDRRGARLLEAALALQDPDRELEQRQVGGKGLEAVAATAQHRAHHQHPPAAVEPTALAQPGRPARRDGRRLDRLAVAHPRLVRLRIPALGQHLLGRRVARDAEATHLAARLAPALAEEAVALEVLVDPALQQPQPAFLPGAVLAHEALVSDALERLRGGRPVPSGPGGEHGEQGEHQAGDGTWRHGWTAPFVELREYSPAAGARLDGRSPAG